MTPRWLTLTAALALAIAVRPAMAETRAPPPAAAASVPLKGKPGPRLMSPAELSKQASPPGDLRPENPVTPQIVIPLRPKSEVPLKAGKATSRPGGSVDDTAARCEALADAAARTACRDRIKP